MISKIIVGVGVLGALSAAEGLNRFGSLVAVFDGADSPYYQFMLIISVVCAGILLLGFFNKSHRIVKWVMFVLLLGCIGLMFPAPSFPVNIQIIIGLTVAAVATLFIRIKKVPKETEE